MDNFPCVALLGARQVGKSTLAKRHINSIENAVYLDLEDPVDFAKLSDPSAYFAANSDKLICIDEIQRYPEIFQILRGHLDRGQRNGQLLILGPASRDLIRQSSETLAGRISYLNINPFQINEVDDLQKLWLQGGYPNSYLKEREFSFEWRKNYIRTFLERDIPNLGFNIPAMTLRRLWQMLAHSNGQLLNQSRIGESLGLSSTTIKKHIDLLEGTFVIRQLPAYFTNTKKIASHRIKLKRMNDTDLCMDGLKVISYKAIAKYIRSVESAYISLQPMTVTQYDNGMESSSYQMMTDEKIPLEVNS
ncbi:MAG: ATP-binding protein [Bacteriovoracaceae bacterium]